MASLGLDGPFDLDSETIDEKVTKTSPGNYALGYVDKDKKFIVYYVGRSDDNLNWRLHQWVGKNAKYKSFKFAYATSAKAAYEKECQNYHDFGGNDKLKNKVHPALPERANWKCPVCKT